MRPKVGPRPGKAEAWPEQPENHGVENSMKCEKNDQIWDYYFLIWIT